MGVFQELPEWLRQEHVLQKILVEQEQHGWYFDERSAWELASTLRRELEEITDLLRNRHPFIRGPEFTPKRDNGPAGYVAGATFTRLKEFNPGSRDHIAWILKEFYNWKPLKETKTGKPEISEQTLKSQGSEFALDCARLLELKKLLGFLDEGQSAWLKLSRNKRLHHSCHVSCISSRCSHRGPNLAQTPSDHRFRELLTATPGMEMVGSDLSGIELRMLAHYLRDDDFTHTLLNGDIHQSNADKIGVSRKQVKTITYGLIYGQSDTGLGLSYDSSLSKQKAASKGKEIRAKFMAALPSLDKLIQKVHKSVATCGAVPCIDGRWIPCSSNHRGLNYLLQSGAAAVAKSWLIIVHEWVQANEVKAHQLAFVHDEIQYECSPKYVNDLKSYLVKSAQLAGEKFNLRCPIAAEASSGPNWGATH